MKTIKLIAILIFVDLAKLAAQETPLVSYGARVRISVSTLVRLYDQISAQSREEFVETESVIGTVAELTADTLKLTIAEKLIPLVIPFTSIKKLEISRGHIPRGKNVLKGTGIGLLVGAGVGVLVGLKLDDTSSNEMPAEGNMLLFGAVGGGTGLVVGSIIGVSSSTEHWEKVPLETFWTGFTPRGG